MGGLDRGVGEPAAAEPEDVATEDGEAVVGGFEGLEGVRDGGSRLGLQEDDVGREPLLFGVQKERGGGEGREVVQGAREGVGVEAQGVLDGCFDAGFECGEVGGWRGRR
jgi:hypothetical protein